LQDIAYSQKIAVMAVQEGIVLYVRKVSVVYVKTIIDENFPGGCKKFYLKSGTILAPHVRGRGI